MNEDRWAVESPKTNNVNQTSQDQGGGSNLNRLLLLGLALGAAYVFVRQWPDLKRYMKMRQM